VTFFSVVRREVTIAGSMIYQEEFPEAMQLVASGTVRTRPLVTHRFGPGRHRRGVRGAPAARSRSRSRC
jgi:threonine dehydrogenase-like Zn-dependent dehydrogenase